MPNRREFISLPAAPRTPVLEARDTWEIDKSHSESFCYIVIIIALFSLLWWLIDPHCSTWLVGGVFTAVGLLPSDISATNCGHFNGHILVRDIMVNRWQLIVKLVIKCC